MRQTKFFPQAAAATTSINLCAIWRALSVLTPDPWPLTPHNRQANKHFFKFRTEHIYDSCKARKIRSAEVSYDSTGGIIA